MRLLRSDEHELALRHHVMPAAETDSDEALIDVKQFPKRVPVLGPGILRGALFIADVHPCLGIGAEAQPEFV